MVSCEHRVTQEAAAANAEANLKDSFRKRGRSTPQGAVVAGVSGDLCQLLINGLIPHFSCVYPEESEKTCPLVKELSK